MEWKTDVELWGSERKPSWRGPYIGQGDKQSQVLGGAVAAAQQRTMFICALCGKH